MDSPSKFGFNTPDFDALRISTSHEGTDRPRRSTRSGISTISGTSTVFNTAVTSASDGSVGGALEPNDKFVGLKEVADSSLLCCMYIPKSGDDRVCVKPKNECHAVSHVKPATLENDCLYVCPRKDQILVGNQLAKMWLSEKEFAEVMANKQSKQLWFTYFDRVKDSQAWESVNTPTSQITLEEAVQGEEDLKSPRKVRLSELIPEFKDDDVAVEDILEKPHQLHRLVEMVNERGEIPKNLEELVRKLVFDWTSVQSNFDALECREDVGRSNLANLKTVLEDVISNTETKFNLIDTKARIIMNLIGNDDEASVNGERSIWKAIRAVQVELAEMKKSLKFDISQLDSTSIVRWQQAEDATNVNKEAIKHNTEFLNEFKTVFEKETEKIFGMMSHLFDELKIARRNSGTYNSGMHNSGMHNSGMNAAGVYGGGTAGIPNSRHAGTSRHAGMYNPGMNNPGMNNPGMNSNIQSNAHPSQLSLIEDLLQDLLDNKPIEKIRELTTRVSLLERQLIDLVGSGNTSGLPTGNNPRSNFRERTTNWAGGFADLNSFGTNDNSTFNRQSNVDGLRDRGVPSGQTNDQFKGMQRDIDLLKKGIEELQKKSKGEGYKSPSVHFHTFNEGMEFVKRTNLDIGYFWDIFSVLVAMLAKRLEAKELSDFKYSAARTMTTKRTSRLEATMTSGRPKVFFGETVDGKPKPMKEGMANCKSWNDWQGTQEPFKEFCTTELNTFLEGVQGDLPELMDEPDLDKRDGINLAIHLLTQVKNQWTALVGFIQTAYNELRSKGGFSEKTAWILVGRYVAAIFNAMIKSRNKSRSLDDSTTLRGKATLFWSVIQCHRIMEEFIDAEFSRHPLIVKETSFFTLIDRVSAEELVHFKREIEQQIEGSNKRMKLLEAGSNSNDSALANRVKDLEDALKTVQATAKDTLKNYNSLLNQYNQLKSRVDNKVDKNPPTSRPDGTLRGLARGCVESPSSLTPCVVFGQRYPIWLPILKQLGYRPVLVFLHEKTYLTKVEASIPEGCTVLSGEYWQVFAADLPVLHSTHVAFVDGKPSAEVLRLSQQMTVSVVYGIGAPRGKLPREWKLRRTAVAHHHEGGVTTGTHHIVGCVHKSASSHYIQVPESRPVVPRDLSTVLEATAPLFRLRPRAAETETNLATYEVRNVGTSLAPVYHGGGWLPPKPTPYITIKTPSVFTEGDRWTLRRLQPKEFLYAHDWGDFFVELLSSHIYEQAFPKLVPGNSLVSGVTQLALVLRDLLASTNEGGGSSSSSPSSSTPTTPSLSASMDVSVDQVSASSESYISEVSNQADTTNSKSVGQTVLRKRTQDYVSLEGVSSKGTKRQQTDKVVLDSTALRSQESKEDNLLSEMARSKRERKATKSDDAQAPIYLWTEHYMEDSKIEWDQENLEEERSQVQEAMETLRSKLFLWKWKRRLMKEFNHWITDGHIESGSKWLTSGDEPGRITETKIFHRYRWTTSGRKQYQTWYQQRKDNRKKDFEAGADAIQRACRSTWWEWSDGSRPFHWRWPVWYRSTIRDGLEVHLSGKTPVYTMKQSDESNPEVKEKVKEKLSKVRARRYIAKGYVVSLTSFFSVPKGETDIRMVYDGTKSGLNEAMWVPRFGLPTIDTHLRSIEEGTFLADVDVGDCFLNFPLHSKLQALAGVDLTCYFPNPDNSPVWECWHRALMGVKSSPYQAVQGMTVAEEVIRGDPTCPKNVFRWDSVRMNCPGAPDYDPSKPWVSKIRKDNTIAADLVGYVDDLRPSGSGRAEAWAAARRTASILNHLGIQDASRKRRDSSRKPGAWAGSVVVTREDGVFVTSDEEKWLKAKAMVVEILEMLTRDPKKLDRKRLESIRGFLIYVVRTYPPMKPYITGLHLTIDGWRPTRDDDGWRLSSREIIEFFKNRSHQHTPQEQVNAPNTVEAKPRLLEDMKALELLLADEKPLLRRVRSKKGRKVAYTFGDASEAGFGRTLAIDGKTYYQYGQWDHRSHGKSSNWREAQNLLDGLELAAQEYALRGLEIFIFTDNSAAEGAFWKGTSPSPLLSKIALRMRQLEMKYDLILHVMHVSGKRMIKQGTDGLSRADQTTGVMSGKAMEDFIPLNLSALERSPALETCLRLHLDEFNFRFLKPEGWFDEYHNYGNYIWAPPPAAADVVVDLINKARHKRPESMHLVLVPRLMTGRWRRLMARSSDYYFVIDWANCWDLRTRCILTWQGYCHERTCRKCVTIRNGLFCANYFEQRGRFAPCQIAFCSACYVPRGKKPFVIRELIDENGDEIVEREDNRYRRGREGDPFMVSFQCDLCHFRNILDRDPWMTNPDDLEILEYIRRANIDAFWSRESSTVKGNLRLLIRAETNNAALKMPPLVNNMGPFPLRDDFGMQIAIAVLIRSLDKGKYENFVQWETFRKTRSALTNAHQAGVNGLMDVIGAYEKNRVWISQASTHSFWFTRFMEGIHRRVGEVIKQDWPVPIKVIMYIDEELNELWESLTDSQERLKIAQLAVWFVCGFCTGLRGEEMLMIELAGTADRLRFLENPVNADEPYFELRIRGRTKSIQMSGSNFGLPCVAVTSHSKLKPGRWIKRLVQTIHDQGRRTGRLFERNLQIPRLVEFEDDWFSILEHVQRKTELIEERIDLRDSAGILRSLRRGVTSHAKNRNVPEPLIHAVNRWRSEKGGNKKGGLPMVDRYTELGTLTPTYLRFSKAL